MTYFKEGLKMAKNIQDILDMLHISVIGKKIDEPHYMIREAYKLPRYIARDYNDCCELGTKYLQYHFSKWTNCPTLLPTDMAFAQVREILDKLQGGFVGAVKNAIRGREKGLVGFIDVIADSLRDEAVEKYIMYVVTTHIPPMDYDLKVRLMKEYLKKYASHILPNEQLMSPYELAANIESLIKFHMEWINSLRKNIQ